MSTADLGEDGLLIFHISKITVAKILGKPIGPSGLECELEPLWSAAHLVQKTGMGDLCTLSYEG